MHGKEATAYVPPHARGLLHEEEVRKLRTRQKEEARGRREQAERWMTEKEEAFERREDAERWMRSKRKP